MWELPRDWGGCHWPARSWDPHLVFLRLGLLIQHLCGFLGIQTPEPTLLQQMLQPLSDSRFFKYFYHVVHVVGGVCGTPGNEGLLYPIFLLAYLQRTGCRGCNALFPVWMLCLLTVLCSAAPRSLEENPASVESPALVLLSM